MPSRESITATIDLDDLELPQRPTSGWNPADEAGRALVEQAVRNAFSPLGGSPRALVQHDRVVVTLKAGREPVTGAQLLDKALRQAGAGKIGAAIETLQRALRADPANPQIHYNLGVAFVNRKDVDAASIAFVRALGLSPTPSANVLLALGNIARGRGDPGRARRFYERARQRDPHSAIVTRNLGAVLAETGELDAAIDAFRHSLECDPTAAETHLGLAMALASRGRLREAEHSYREAITLAGGDGPVASVARNDLRAMGVDVAASVQPQAAGARQAGNAGGKAQPALLPATQEILARTTALTGRDFEFVAQDGLPSRAAIRIARGGMARHRILFLPGAVGVDHLIAHECGHVVRLWSVGPEERRLATSDKELQVAAIQQLGDELTRLANKGIPPEVLARMFETVYHGTVRQVTNIPIDLHIERWLYENYPGLREAQRESLLSQLQEARQVLAPNIAQATPPTVFHASNAMNCAFARGVARLYDEPKLAEPYRDSRFWTIGGDLLALLDQVPDDARGDVDVVDRWAEILHVRAWYRWAALDSLPPAQTVVSA